MQQYVLSVYQPDGDPPPPEILGPIMQRVEAWLQELKAAKAWVFNLQLHPPGTATVVRAEGSEMLMTDGPYTEAKEHVGGLTIIRAPDLDVALEWAGKLASAATLPIEVRPMLNEVAG